MRRSSRRWRRRTRRASTARSAAEYAARSGQPVDRTGDGTVAEVYPAASLRVWGLEPVAALTARAAALKDRTLRPRTPEEAAAATREGWVAVPLRGTSLGQLIK
jgi:hypothetical protein